MKFIKNLGEDPHILLLDIHYYPGDRYKYNEKDDYIDVLYKDMDTGRKYVETIIHPVIELWIVKKEFRHLYETVHNFYPIEHCYKITVPYKERYSHVAKELGIPVKEVKTTPLCAQLDMTCESFYQHQFKLEYDNDKQRILSLGFLDIENDISQFRTMAEPGEAPIDSVSIVLDQANMAYLLVNTNHYLPELPESHKYHDKYKTMIDRFNESMNEFRSNPDKFIDTCHERFDDVDAYRDIQYQVLFFDNEIELIATTFQILEKSGIDFLGIWNAPYDIQNLIERPKKLGYDANSIIIDRSIYPDVPGCKPRSVLYVEDHNPLAHKRNHKCELFTPYITMCMMRNYAGIRSARGKLPSLKLGNIAQAELKDTKIDYSEYGNIRWFKYNDLFLFYLYSMKDTLLLRALARKTKDFDVVYTTIYSNVVLPNQEFTSTTIIENAIRHFAYTYKGGYVMGSNSNKWNNNSNLDYNKFFKFVRENEKMQSLEEGEEATFSEDEANFVMSMETNEDELEYYDPTEFAAMSESEQGRDVRVKFVGAFVLNTGHVKPTGFRIYEVESKYIHEFVIDYDVRSEYPSAMLAMNASNDTLLGKVFLNDWDDVRIPVYDDFEFFGKEESDNAKMDPATWLTEQMSTGDILNVGHVAFHLPNIDDLLIDVKEKFIN